MQRHFLENLGLAVFSDGRIYSVVTKRFIKGWPDGVGYMRVTFKDFKGVKHTFSVHRLVALAFLPNPESKPEVNHIDAVKSNNDLSNLEWVTKSENHFHAGKLGLKVNCGPKPNTERNNAVKEMRKTGLSYKKIGEHFGISAPRARGICLGNKFTRNQYKKPREYLNKHKTEHVKE